MNPLHAILRPPELEAFLRRFGLRAGELEVSFDGWHKRAILAPESVFLFPRHQADAALIEREAAALTAVASIGSVPTLIGLWNDADISPLPFLQTARKPGTSFDEVIEDLPLEAIAEVLDQVGVATARWHELDTRAMPSVLRRAPCPQDGWWADALEPGRLRAAVERAFETLSCIVATEIAPDPTSVDIWEALLEPLTRLDPVLTHGDVHETQLLLDEDLRLEAVLDWDHACIANPVRDFNFGEWGSAIFSWEESFDSLYESYWESYRRSRSVPLPGHRSVLLYRALGDAVWACERLRDEPSSWWHAHRLRRCAEHIASVRRHAR